MTQQPGQVTDAAIEDSILGLLSARQAGSTLCPSEVARGLALQEADWRALMPQVRQVAQALADAGRLRITRGGKPVNALDAGGPIRLGRPD